MFNCNNRPPPSRTELSQQETPEVAMRVSLSEMAAIDVTFDIVYRSRRSGAS